LTEVSRISVVSGPTSPPDLVVVARITTIHGVKGWVKIHPYTDEPENIFDYKPWWLQTDQGWKEIQVVQYKVASQNLIVQILDFDDRDIARQELYCSRAIRVSGIRFK
jgi:16S rRNA processing protein RimM